MRSFAYHAPKTLDEAIALLHELPEGARPVAGGTDIVVQMKEGRTKFPYPQLVVSLDRISALKGIEYSAADGLRIGSGATMSEVANHPAVREHYLALAEGAGVVGSLQTMNMGTIGGNVCNAAPSADTAPALLAFEATAVIVGRTAQRSLPLSNFFVGPGRTALKPGELLAELRLPAPPTGTTSAYQRHTPRKQMDIAVVGVGVALTIVGGKITRARVSLGAVAPTPIRAPKSEAALEGQSPNDATFAGAAEIAASEASPIADVRGSADFRRHLVKVMTARMLARAAERAKG
ncbi:MAG: xanthine dehydrogenase family protein subunit M [Chloroflexota bacterium]